MDKIAELLEKLDNKVTPTIAKRLDGLNSLEQRLEVAKKELEANPDDEELKESHQEIADYISDYEEDLIEDLEALVKAKQQKPVEKKPTEEKPTEEKPTEEKPVEQKPVEEKESSTNIAGWIFGGLLLVGSLGAINYFRNNR
jgi:cell division septation protein DedD